MTSKQEVEMFGCSMENLKRMFETPLFGARPSMLVMSILSDVQELLAMIPDDGTGHTGERLELARQYINRAKWGITEYLNDDTDKHELPNVEG